MHISHIHVLCNIVMIKKCNRCVTMENTKYVKKKKKTLEKRDIFIISIYYMG